LSGYSSAIGYLDSSVALRMILDGPERGELLSWFVGVPFTWVSSRLLKTECVRTLVRENLPLTYADEVLDRVNLIGITERVHYIAEGFEKNIRTLDAMHLATLLSLGQEKFEQLIVLVSHDKQMLETALAHSVPISDPVADLTK